MSGIVEWVRWIVQDGEQFERPPNSGQSSFQPCESVGTDAFSCSLLLPQMGRRPSGSLRTEGACWLQSETSLQT